LRQVEYRVESILELVHGDICGPITPMKPSGNRYFILLVDDVSRFMWVKTLASKDVAVAAIKQFQAAVEAETDHRLRAFRSDRGGEFNLTDFIEHCTKHGVRGSSQLHILLSRTTSWSKEIRLLLEQ
jgi:hypothetical protein